MQLFFSAVGNFFTVIYAPMGSFDCLNNYNLRNNSTNLERHLFLCLRAQRTVSTVHLCYCGFQQYTGCNLQGACAVGEMSLR